MRPFVEFVFFNLKPIINSTGLIFDIVGAFLVATEVVYQFNSNKFKATLGIPRADYLGSDGTPIVVVHPAEETDDYKNWELKKYWRMKVGLVFLTFGFLLQITSNWIK